MSTPKPRICKDCKIEMKPDATIHRWRDAPFPGPRCATHHRQETRRRRLAASGRHVQRTYGLSPEEYERLYEAQGRRCAICRRATGKAKRLAVDHDHSCCPGPTSCGGCVRGLLCGPCNDVMAHARDDRAYFLRALEYLRAWPSLTADI